MRRVSLAERQVNRDRKRDAGEEQRQRLAARQPASSAADEHAGNHRDKPSAAEVSQSTAPLALCDRAEENDVGMMVASDVPTAMCMRTSGSTPSIRDST